MTLVTYEPPPLEIKITLGLGLTVLSPYYRGFARELKLRGDERVLDFGSGSGVCTRHIAAQLEHDGCLDCVDISRGWMEVIRKTLGRYKNVGYYCGRISEIPLPDAAYDVVVIHFVLHDIPSTERPEVVNALGRKLKPGGRLVVREPQGESLALGELNRLAGNANLQSASAIAHKAWWMSVYDAAFVRFEESS